MHFKIPGTPKVPGAFQAEGHEDLPPLVDDPIYESIANLTKVANQIRNKVKRWTPYDKKKGNGQGQPQDGQGGGRGGGHGGRGAPHGGGRGGGHGGNGGYRGGYQGRGGMVETLTMMVVEVDTVVEVDMVEEVDIKVEVVVMVEVVVEEGCLLPVGEVVVGHATIVADRATLAMIATSHVGVAGTETTISWIVLGTQYPRTIGDMGHRTMGILGPTKQ
jgi:hypothetical protein